MKITYNINLDGRVFTIDEDAYRLLNDYLDTLNHAFASEGSEEIVSDIEARISEIFLQNQENGKAVVTLKEVEAVISRIGHPEEMVEDVLITDTIIEENNVKIEEVEEVKHSSTPPPPPYIKPSKRLFRDSQNGMIGGVCAGLSEYLNFDVTWVRLIAVALCFISFSTLALVYVILWIVLPNAVTPYQRMQLMGASPTLQNIGQSVKQFFNSNQTASGASSTSPPPVPVSNGKRVADKTAGFFGTLGKVLIILMMIILIPIEVSLGLALLVCLAVLAGVLCNNDFFTVFQVPGMVQPEVSFLVQALVCAIGIILVFGIPIYFLIRVMNNPAASLNKSTRVAIVITWVCVFIMTVVLGMSLTSYSWPM